MLINETLQWRIEKEKRILWLILGSRNELHYSYKTICTLYEALPLIRETISRQNVRYLVLLSQNEKVWNMGGDLEMFVNCVNTRNIELLRDYAIKCVYIVHVLNNGFDDSVITASVVQGNAFGGGFESALATDYLFAEEHVKFSFPEVIFGTFPGMGAYSLLTRKLGYKKASDMIHSAGKWDAAEMKEAGLVHYTCAKGDGVNTIVRKIISGELSQPDKFLKMCTTVPLSEFTNVVNSWVESVMKLDETQLAIMQRLVNAQKSRALQV